MQNNKAVFSVLISAPIVIWILFSSCKKESGYSITQTTDDSQTQAIIAGDEFYVNTKFDQIVNEAILATSISSTTSGETPPPHVGNALFSTIAGAVIDTGQIALGIIKITYFGTNSDHTVGRSGIVKIQHALDSLGKVIPWKSQGATAVLTFTQYEIVVLATNKSLWFNGSGAVTNVSGELMQNITNPAIVNGDTLVDKVRAQIDFTFNDNVAAVQTWNWSFAQHRLFNGADTTITCAITGDTAINDISNVTTWGATRFDQNFYTSISAPVLKNISGSSFLDKPLSGVKVIMGIPEQMTITYGVDQQGNPQTSGNPYGYKITWFRTGSQQSVIGY